MSLERAAKRARTGGMNMQMALGAAAAMNPMLNPMAMMNPMMNPAAAMMMQSPAMNPVLTMLNGGGQEQEAEQEDIVAAEVPSEAAQAPGPKAPAPPERENVRAASVGIAVTGDSFQEAYQSLSAARGSLFKTTREEMKIPRCAAHLRNLPKAARTKH